MKESTYEIMRTGDKIMGELEYDVMSTCDNERMNSWKHGNWNMQLWGNERMNA